MLRPLLAHALFLAAAPFALAQDDAQRASLERFFGSLSAAVQAGDQDAFVEHADVSRLAKEVFSRSTRRLGFADRLGFTTGLRMGLVQRVENGDLANLGDPHQLRKFALDDDLESGTAIVRYRDGDGVHTYMRWWLTRDDADEPWQFYDFEDLDVNLRASILMASMLAQADDDGGLEDTMEFLTSLQRLGEAYAYEDYEAAEPLLDRMGELEVRDDLRAVYLSSLAGFQEMNWELDEALASLAEARRLRPDMPILDYQAASILRTQGNSEEAVAAARRYRDELGGDAEIDTILGGALADLGRTEEARAAFRGALEDDDQAIDALAGLAGLCGPDDRTEVAERFGDVVDAPDWMDYLADAAMTAGSHDGMLALCDGLDALAPDDPNVEYWRAQVAMEREEWTAALDLLAGALPRAPEEELSAYLAEYAAALVQGLPAEEQVAAYERIRSLGLPAFEAVCGELYGTDSAGIRAIAASYAEVSKEDPNGALWVARSWSDEEDFARAEEAYGEAASLARDDVLAASIHEERIHNLVVAGSLADAYALEPREESWFWILDSAHVLDDAEKLTAALALRTADRPDDPELPAWRGYVAFLADDLDAAAEAFADANLALPRFAEMGYDWSFIEAHARTLARLGRFDEASAIAEAYAEDYEDPLLLAVVAARQGDLDGTRAAVVRCLEGAYWWGELAGDPDLTEILEDPAFEDLREEYDWGGAYEIDIDGEDG